MTNEQVLEELIEVAGQLGLEVRQEKGNFRGGRCTVDDEELIMLNKRHLPEVRLAVLAEALHGLPLDTVYLKPAVRRALEDLWAQQDLTDAPPSSPEEAPTHADE